MTLDEAKHILSLIRHENRYKRMAQYKMRTLQDITREIDSLASPKSTMSNLNGVHSQNPIPVDTRLNELLTEEDETIKEYKKLIMYYEDAKRYKREIFEKTRDHYDREFIDIFISKSMSQIQIEQEYSVSDSYDHMLRIIKSLDIKI